MNHLTCIRCLLRTAVICLLTATARLPLAHADSNLRSELREVAASVAVLARDLKADAVSLENFEFQPSDEIKLKSAGGAGIGQVLAEELQKQKIAVRKGSPLRISCKYDDVIDARSKLIAARLMFQIEDASGKLLTTASRGVFGDAALSALFGETVDLQPKSSDAERSDQMIKSLDFPSAVVEGARVSSSKQSPYAMEVLVESDGQYVPRDAAVNGGQASVKLNVDEFFAVRLHNASEYEAAVFLAIDGMPLFTFSKDERYRLVIVPAKSEMLVRGWFHDQSISTRFQPGVYPKSESLEDRPKVNGPGVITAVFSASYSEDQLPPADEPFQAIVRSFSRSAGASGEELLLSNRRIDPSSIPAEAEIPAIGMVEQVVPDSKPPEQQPDDGAAVAEIPQPTPPNDLPRFATSRCVSTNEATYFDGVRRNFGVVRTAVTVRFSK